MSHLIISGRYGLFLLPDDNPTSAGFAITKMRILLEYPDAYGIIVSIMTRPAAVERAA
jgi:hypothetical protein